MAYMSSCCSHKCTMLHMTVFSSIHLSKRGHFIFNNINNQADGYIYHDLFKSDHIWVLANWNLPSYSSPLVLLEHILPKTACGCPCGRVIQKNQKISHTYNSLTLWNAFVHVKFIYQVTPTVFSWGTARNVQKRLLFGSYMTTETCSLWQLHDRTETLFGNCSTHN